MKHLYTFLAIFILFGFTTVYAQETVDTNDPRWKQLSQAYGFVLGQQTSLKLIEKKFPDITTSVKESWFAFNSSALGDSVKGLEAELSKELRDKWPEYKRTMAVNMLKLANEGQITRQQAVTFLSEVKNRAKGKLPESIRSTLLSVHPRYAKNPELEISEGWKQTFRSKGHIKAKGVDISISFPTSWSQREGTRPNIMQKFSPKRTAPMEMIMLQTISLPKEFNRKLNEEELKEIASLEITQMFLPKQAKIVSHKITKIDGLICSMTEYTATGERAGFEIGQKILSFIIPHDGTLLLINCSVGGDASKGYDVINNRYERAKPLFLLVASSCVFLNKWKQ